MGIWPVENLHQLSSERFILGSQPKYHIQQHIMEGKLNIKEWKVVLAADCCFAAIVIRINKSVCISYFAVISRKMKNTVNHSCVFCMC